MAKYIRKRTEMVKETLHNMHAGKLKMFNSNKQVTNPKQAIAIGVLEAEKEVKSLLKKYSKE